MTQEEFEVKADRYGSFSKCGERCALLTPLRFAEDMYPAFTALCASEESVGTEYLFIYEAFFPFYSEYSYVDESGAAVRNDLCYAAEPEEMFDPEDAELSFYESRFSGDFM